MFVTFQVNHHAEHVGGVDQNVAIWRIDVKPSDNLTNQAYPYML